MAEDAIRPAQAAIRPDLGAIIGFPRIHAD